MQLESIENLKKRSPPELTGLNIGVVGPPEPAVMTRDSAGFKQLKAAILALDILERINRPPDEDIIRQIKERYERLPEDLKKELRLGRAFQLVEARRGAISPTGRGPLFRYAGFLLPLFAGLFLTGCSGTGAGAIGAIGILAVLAAIVPGRDRRAINRRIPLLPPSRAPDTEEDCESEAGLLQSA